MHSAVDPDQLNALVAQVEKPDENNLDDMCAELRLQKKRDSLQENEELDQELLSEHQ